MKTPMIRFASICFMLSILLFSGAVAFGAEPLRFAVIQPGQPGTPQDAAPVMDSLASYLSSKTGIECRGEYSNSPEAASELFKENKPSWGIVSLGFYMEQAEALGMTPMASTKPGGEVKDVWRLVIPAKSTAGSWKDLSGTVQGSVSATPRAAACVLFHAPQDELPFKLEGTTSPLRALRKMLKGKYAGVILDRPQFEATEALSSRSELKVLLESPALPSGPVVWFGTPTPEAKKIADALMGMKNDPEAAGLLQMLRTDGFGPADPALSEKALPQGGTGCR